MDKKVVLRKKEDRGSIHRDVTEQIALNQSRRILDVVNALQSGEGTQSFPEEPSATSSRPNAAVKRHWPTGNRDGALQERTTRRLACRLESGGGDEPDREELWARAREHLVRETNAAWLDCSSRAIRPKLDEGDSPKEELDSPSFSTGGPEQSLAITIRLRRESGRPQHPDAHRSHGLP